MQTRNVRKKSVMYVADNKEKVMRHFRYNMLNAYYDAGIYEYVENRMENLGFHWVKSESVPAAGCWWFRCDKYPNEYPNYISKMPDDFKFSDEKIVK